MNDLLLPPAGHRNYSPGLLTYQGSNAYYWASTPNGINAYNLGINATYLSPQNNFNRAYGFSLRCFKNTPSVPVVDPDAFITTRDTRNLSAGSTDDHTISIPTA